MEDIILRGLCDVFATNKNFLLAGHYKRDREFWFQKPGEQGLCVQIPEGQGVLVSKTRGTEFWFQTPEEQGLLPSNATGTWAFYGLKYRCTGIVLPQTPEG